jgi:hypothetical protein
MWRRVCFEIQMVGQAQPRAEPQCIPVQRQGTFEGVDLPGRGQPDQPELLGGAGQHPEIQQVMVVELFPDLQHTSF